MSKMPPKALDRAPVTRRAADEAVAGHAAAHANGALETRPSGASSRHRERIRVLCVDDHDVLVQGLRAQFALDDRIELVGSLDSAERLLSEARAKRPHVVLLDIEMPGPDAFEMADRLRHAMPEVRIIVLSAHIREALLAAAYKCGLSGYFSKADQLPELVRAIHQVAMSPRAPSGEPDLVLGAKVRERCFASVLGPVERGGKRATSPLARVKTRLAELSERELEVLRLIGRGLTREAIADQLSRSVKTIDGHQLRIKAKLGVHSREDLMLFAIREGLAEVR